MTERNQRLMLHLRVVYLLSSEFVQGSSTQFSTAAPNLPNSNLYTQHTTIYKAISSFQTRAQKCWRLRLQATALQKLLL